MATETVGFIFPATGQNGPNNPDSAGFPNGNWTTPEDITASADYASGGLPDSSVATTKYLQGREYDFSSLKSNKSVLGVELRFDYYMRSDNTGTTMTINHVSLIQSDALSGTDRDPSLSVTNGTITRTTKTMGGASDLWGLSSLNTNDIKGDAGFGFGVAGKGEGSSGELRIFSHEMKIYYEDTGQVKVWTGAAFEIKDVKYYDGANFELTSKVKYWNGSAFVATLD